MAGTLSFPGVPSPFLLTPPAEISTAGGLVADRFNNASSYASEMWSVAQDMISKLGGTDFPVSWDPVTLEPIDPGGLDGISAEEPPVPAIDDVVMRSIDFPYLSPESVTTDMPDRDAPTNNAPDPGIVIPDAPDVTIPKFSAEVPDITDAAPPTAPTLPEVAVPQLSDITIPSPPEYNIPEFEWELPTDDLTPPDPQFVWNEAEYDSTIKTALADKLYSQIVNPSTELTEYDSDLVGALTNKLYSEVVSPTEFDEYTSSVKQRVAYNLLRDLVSGFLKGQYYTDVNALLADKLYYELGAGGTGLNEETEQAIYDRAVSRQLDEEQDKLDQILNFFSDRMYELPPGALSNQMLELNNKILKTREDLNRDILTQQSNLAQVNTHFVITSSIGREKHLMDQDDRYNKDVITQTQFTLGSAVQSEGQNMTYDLQHTKNFMDYIHAMIVAALQNEKSLMDNKLDYDKLTMEHIHYIINSAIVNEKNLMDYSNEFQNRALDAAKFVVQGALLIYQTKVEAYKAKLAVYTAQAEVYKARIAGEVAKAEFYKAQVEGVIASTEVQKAVVALYSAQIDANKIWIELYNAEMQGAMLQAEVDKTKIVAFSALVQAYSAQVAAVTEQYKGYQAQIAGEVAKTEVYKSQVQAYAVDVEAYKTLVEADSLEIQQDIEKNRNAIEVYKSQIQKYVADAQVAESEVDALIKAEGLKIDIYKALTSNYGTELDALVKVFMSKVEEAKATASIEIQEADLVIKETLAKYDLLIKSISASAQVASQMAAAAISGVSASANIQNSESRSDSTSITNSNQNIQQSVISNSAEWKYIWTYEGD